MLRIQCEQIQWENSKRKEIKFKNIDLRQYREIEVVNYLNATKYDTLNLLIILSLRKSINIVAYIKQYCSNS